MKRLIKSTWGGGGVFPYLKYTVDLLVRVDLKSFHKSTNGLFIPNFTQYYRSAICIFLSVSLQALRLTRVSFEQNEADGSSTNRVFDQKRFRSETDCDISLAQKQNWPQLVVTRFSTTIFFRLLT